MEDCFSVTGLDKELPYIEVLMEKTDTAAFPQYALPEGYAFRLFEPGMEEEFAQLQYLVGGSNSIESAREIFIREFSGELDVLRSRMLYVTAPGGECAGTACLWYGDHLGKNRPRVHWVAVHPSHQNKGLCKALLTRLFELYNTLGLEHSVYLTTQTWSYKAISVYIEYGFNPYICENPDCYDSCDYQNRQNLAWNLIFDKIEQYANAKEKEKDYGR
jgi:GNAT superfamily N-acetyltransferase